MTKRPTDDAATAADLLDEASTEVLAPSAVEALTRGEVDIQIVTANKFPRSIKRFLASALDMATLDADTASACMYAVPRDGKTIKGASVRLAEIAASAWGHMRVEGRLVEVGDRFVTARGTAWDMQTNVAFAVEVNRRITDKKGRRYSDDMIGTTSAAATSIAIRNAIFKVIPAAYTNQIYAACRAVAVGTQETLSARRDKALAHFQKVGVDKTKVFAQLDVKGVADITLDHLETLLGWASAIKEGASTIEEIFPEPKPEPAKPVAITTTSKSKAEAVISKNQVKAILDTGKAIGWDEEEIRAMVREKFKTEPLEALHVADFDAVIEAIESPD